MDVAGCGERARVTTPALLDVLVWQPTTLEMRMRWRNEPEKDAVTVHVTPRGGLYVNPAELLRSEAAREMMRKMDRVLRADKPKQSGAEALASSPQGPRERSSTPTGAANGEAR